MSNHFSMLEIPQSELNSTRGFFSGKHRVGTCINMENEAVETDIPHTCGNVDQSEESRRLEPFLS